MPLVSVLLPAYNAEVYISEAIQSILNQTFTDFELIIINDGSKDSTKVKIESFKDSRIRYTENEQNIRLIATLNKGIELSKSKYIARMDADDIALPERLQKQWEFMEANKVVGVCGSNFKTIGKINKQSNYGISDNEIRWRMLYQCPFCHPTVMMRKSIFENYKFKYDDAYLHAEDYALWIEMSKTINFANLPEVLLAYRVHHASVSKSNNDFQQKQTEKLIKELWLKIGVELTEEDLPLIKDIFYAQFDLSFQELQRVESILSKLLIANNITQFINPDFLGNSIRDKWFHLCYNNPHFDGDIAQLYRKSPLKADSYLKSGKMQLKAILA